MVKALVTCREADQQEIVRWDEIVGQFDNHRMFHREDWLRSVRESTGAQLLHLVFERNHEIVGCLPGFLTSVGPIRFFCSPREGWQAGIIGPAFDPGKLSTHDMITGLMPFLRTRYGVHVVEIVSAGLDHAIMSQQGFLGQPLFTYRVPLFPNEPERMMRNIKSKTRNQLRKAIKLGLTARVESDESFVDEFYDQVVQVFARRGKAVSFSRDRVVTLFRHMHGTGRLLPIGVYGPEGQTCMATGMFLIDGRELYLWMWAHRTEFRWYCPTELLTWTAMRIAAEAGCTTFDMAGGGDAKEKFGAIPDERVYRWIWVRYAWLIALRDLARRAFKWQQSVRGRLVWKRIVGYRANTNACANSHRVHSPPIRMRDSE